jgi:hypothetical protein
VSDAVGDVLRLVADGRLSAAEAEPILAALEETREETRDEHQGAGAARERSTAQGEREPAARTIRLEVTDHGRVVVNLRLPASLGELGLRGVPGLTGPNVDRIRAALASGTRGPVFEAIGEDGDGVRILIE